VFGEIRSVQHQSVYRLLHAEELCLCTNDQACVVAACMLMLCAPKHREAALCRIIVLCTPANSHILKGVHHKYVCLYCIVVKR
jgi:hypothetical protein